ncbi:MAG: diguanylate cyclase [Thermoguttaceae bacterium]
MTSQPLKVLIVAEDRRILRQSSKSLEAFGYTVQQVADWQLALAALDIYSPEVLIVDSEPNPRAALEFCGSADRRVRSGHPYTFLIVGRPTAQELTEGLEAGVDDFLEKPIVHGELLARLRTAARLLEFDRRVAQQAGADLLTHLPSRVLFCDLLRRILSRNNLNREPATCVLADLDYLGRINHLYGYPAGDKVLREVGELLTGFCRQSDFAASFGGGRFGVLLNKTSEDEATTWTDRVREALAETEFSVGDTIERLTASFGIAALQCGLEDPEEVIDRAAAALKVAKHSGRHCVVRHGEFDGDAEAWADFGAPGKLFDCTVARHIMTPCTTVLQGESTIAAASDLFRRTGAEALPVIDQGGKMAGLLLKQSVLSGPIGVQLASLQVRDLLTCDVPVYDEATSFTTLRDFFTRDSRSLVVIVDDDVPTGFVTPNSLAALSSPPVTDRFAPTGPLTAGSRYLMVPDLCPLDGLQ